MTGKRHLIALLLLLSTGAAHSAGIDVLGDLLKPSVVQPGGKVEGTIVVANATNDPQQVRVYQTDYSGTVSEKSYGDPGTVPRSNSSWISFSPKETTIPPKSQIQVYYTVQVPDKADLVGSYWSMLMVEPIAADLVTPTGPGSNSQIGMRTKFRYAVEILTQIGDTGHRNVRFADRQALMKNGVPTLRLDIENTGECWLRPVVRVELYDTNGISRGHFEAPRGQILPGCQIRREIQMSGVKAGKYKALVVVDNGDQYVWGAQYDLDLH